MEEVGIGLVAFIPFSHLKQTPMQVVRHVKFKTHENHKEPKVIHENETVPALTSDELFSYHQQVMPSLLQYVYGQTLITRIDLP